ncbi:MAG TPA: protein kinase [Polyangiales bacterium]|nr:protein kinase [Polyangiales bacterium]
MTSIHPQPPHDTGTRYETLRLLGQGNAGAVYLARDRETGGLVARKKLLRVDLKSVLRLKREFRALADVRHPNLVELYELEASEDGWFLAMEYVEGSELLAALRSELNEHEGRGVDQTRDLHQLPADGASPLAIEPVLGVFLQLASGIDALHRAGLLHRDLKPSNVLVAKGRVVVLDFGLVLGLDAESVRVTHEGTVAGTPAYMAPEQAAAAQLSAAADWYAFGVMLFEALTGELPIQGRSAAELASRKTRSDAQPIERVRARLPDALVTLCNRLLLREPQRRPDGARVIETLRVLLGRPATETEQRTSLEITLTTQVNDQSMRAPPGLVGRDAELRSLMAAFELTRQGAPGVVHVRGTSGTGKTALVESFLASLGEDLPPFLAAPLVLRSRCTEREAMPYKALDGVIDGLVRHLLAQDAFAVGRMLPPDLPELVRLFPALQRVPVVQRLLATAPGRSDRVQARIAGEAAMREMFARLADLQPLVIWIDDLQWGDLDSARILKTWQEQLGSSAALLIFTYRSDELATSPALREVLEQATRPRSIAARIVELAPLDPADVQALCNRRLGAVARERPDLVEKIALESQGNPFLASQLAALVQAKVARGDSTFGELSIEQLIVQATQLLPPEAVTILDVLAVAGRPLSAQLALKAAGVEHGGRAHLHALRSLRLIRARNVGTAQLIEPYHDRVREGVAASVDLALRTRLQAALVRALEHAENVDSGWLFSLALEADLPEAALQHGLAAAEHAESVFAFERAAELFERCISLREQAGDVTSELTCRLADCLARAGHGVRAAELFLSVAQHSEARQALSLQRIAASHLLRCGEYERGNRLVDQVLRAYGLSVPQTDAGVLAALVWERARASVRGTSFKDTDTVPSASNEEVELYGSLAIEYQVFDPVRTALFQSRALRLALGAGGRREIAFALAATAVVTCVNGSEKAARETESLLERAESIVDELDDDTLRVQLLVARAVSSYMLGRARDIIEPSYEAERVFRNTRREHSGEYYQRFIAVAVRIGGLLVLGDYARAMPELARAAEEARLTNNRNAILQLSLVQTVVDGLRDDYQNAKLRLEQERKLLPQDRFGPLHTLHLISLFRVACGLHDYVWAADWIEHDWNKWKRSIMRMSAFMSMLVLGSRLRYLVNRHVIERRDADIDKLVRWELKALTKIPLDEARFGLPLRTGARLDVLAGRRDAAREKMTKVAAELDRIGSHVEAARERLVLALITGGTAGNADAVQWEQRMRECGFVSPMNEVYACYPELREFS